MALTANASIEGRGEGGVVAFAVKSLTRIWRNSIVGLEVSGGVARPATAGGAPDIRAGVAREEVDNTAGADGDKDVEVYTEGEFLLPGSGFFTEDVGVLVYALDDGTITKTATNNVLLGRITKFVSSGQVWVKLLPFAVAS